MLMLQSMRVRKTQENQYYTVYVYYTF